MAPRYFVTASAEFCWLWVIGPSGPLLGRAGNGASVGIAGEVRVIKWMLGALVAMVAGLYAILFQIVLRLG